MSVHRLQNAQSYSKFSHQSQTRVRRYHVPRHLDLERKNRLSHHFTSLVMVFCNLQANSSCRINKVFSRLFFQKQTPMSILGKIEQEVRDILSKKLRASLSEQRLVIGYRADKTPQYHRFDIVSDDKIIGEVKSYK